MSIGRLFTQTVTVESFVGMGADGETYGAPTTVPCYIENVSRLTTTGTSDEATLGAAGSFAANTTIYAAVSYEASFPLQSRVTMDSTRTGRVLQVNTFRSPGRDSRNDHIEVHLI